MCGISGVVGAPLPVAQRCVATMNHALRHRGPEGVSVFALGRAMFGHTRLSFVDIPHSSQPFRHPDASLLVAFNGEIYNHTTIRKELACAISGEAALLAALFQREGPAMVDKLEGMYAVAVYAAEEEALYLLRDPYGQKPLSYAIAGEQVYFASEAQALECVLHDAGEIAPQSLAAYLTHNAVPPPCGLRTKIRQVPAGAVLRIQQGEVTTPRQWWPVARTGPARWGSVAEHEAVLESALGEAARSHLPKEVPYGFFLSGGLDSSLIAAIAQKQTGACAPCFTIQFRGAPTFDESAWAGVVAKHLAMPHRVVPLSLSDLARMAERMLPAVDMPIADHSFLPTVALAEAARPEVKAVLTGDGADELLMGYRIFEAMALARSITRFVPRSALRALLARCGRGWVSERNLDARQAAGPFAVALDAPPAHAYMLAAAAFAPGDWRRILSPEAFAAVRPADAFAQIEELLANWNGPDEAEQLQAGMLTHFLRHVILAKLDRATMQMGLEARSPFLSRGVSEVALGLPRNQKLRGWKGKDILRRIARRYLPAPVVDRRKQGFRAPIAALLRGPLREFAGDHLSEASLRRHGLMNAAEVARLLREHLNVEADHHRALWSLLCFQCWETGSRGRQRSGCRDEEGSV